MEQAAGKAELKEQSKTELVQQGLYLQGNKYLCFLLSSFWPPLCVRVAPLNATVRSWKQ